jgi:hypothetical protein
MKNKIFKELINHLIYHGEALNKERLNITVRLDYSTDEAKKNFIAFSINSNILKANNPGVIFMENQEYFKNSREMVKFFIENVFKKHVGLNTNKPFSKHVISLSDLNKIKSDNLHIFLDEDLAVKNQKTITQKI